MLHAGVDVRKVFELAAEKTSDPRCRETLREISNEIQNGGEISSAMRDQGNYFPQLLIDMVSVAEESGALPEVLAHMGKHYENNLQLRRNFVAAISWPLFQLVAAIFVIAALIYILGIIGKTAETVATSGHSVSFLVFGLSGPDGALIWLMYTFGSLLSLFVVYQILSKAFSTTRVLDSLLLWIPILGNCMRSFAIARFSWAFYLTQQTGMPIRQSLRASFRATANGAFIAAAPMVCHRVESGDNLSDALTASGLFPDDYLHIVNVAETSGTVPEMVHRLSPQFEDQARRSLNALTTAFGWLIWLVVAGFIIFFVFRFILWYVSMINDAVQGNF